MIPISEANFVVVDIETTGNSAINDRITDIACITVKNFEIIDIYSSLINPHQHIPWYVQKLTGITNSMVRSAPESNKIFPIIRDLFDQENTYFVAHSSKFDSSFVYETFRRESIDFNEVPTICTLKISQKILPKNIKKSVGSIADFFQIPILNRHRAYDDAFATANFFIELLYMLQDRYEIFTVEEVIAFQDTKQNYIPKLNAKTKNKLLQYKKLAPVQSGIVMFIGANSKILHISKTNNISQHINSFVEQVEIYSEKINKILKKFIRIEWLETSNELETYVLENRKIKFYEPEFNSYKNVDLFNADDVKINSATQKILFKKLSMIVLLPNSEREKTIDVYFINNGKYINMLTVGSKANLDMIFDEIHNVFYLDVVNYEVNIDVDLDEVRIINNWLQKYTCIAKIFLYEEQDELILDEEIENIIRSFYNDPVEENDFYVGTFIYE
jgi:DNA polymerase III epsilon subunit-like protein